MSSGNAKRGTSRLLNITSPGKVPGTVRVKYLLRHLHSLSGKDVCTPHNTYYSYRAFVMSSDDRSEKRHFNNLQFAHRLLPLLYDGTQPNRLEHFTGC